MNKPEELQQLLFSRIKNSIDPGISLADEVSEVLNISTDSAYRRIRGEKPLVFDEIFTLCQRYKVSVDDIFSFAGKGENFLCRIIDSNSISFEEYMMSLYKTITQIQLMGNPEITYFAKDIPIFLHFHFPELAAFKLFFWSKTLKLLPEFSDKKFDKKMISDQVLETGRNTLSVYNKVCSSEIWNEETVNSALRQIEFYYTGGIFNTKDDALFILDAYQNLFNHIKSQAELGAKFFIGNQPLYQNNYKFYYNEVIQGDNTIYVKSDNRKLSFITFSVLSLMVSDEDQFCQKVDTYLKIMMKKSTLLSEVSEKERNRFFNVITDKIHTTAERIKNM